MLRQPLAWAAFLAALTAAERVHQKLRGEVLPFPDSCDKLKTGSYKVNKSGLQLQDCTISAGTDVKVELKRPLIVHGNLTVRGNATFWSPKYLRNSFQEACLQVDHLTVSGKLVMQRCQNFAADGQGGCLKATSLFMEEGLLDLKHCTSMGEGGGAALGSLHQRAGEMRFTECTSTDLLGGGLYVEDDLTQAGGQLAFKDCHAHQGGGLYAGKASTNGTIRIEGCSADSGGGAIVKSLQQGPAGRFQCHGCKAILPSTSRLSFTFELEGGIGGCLLVYGGILAEGRVEAEEVSASDASAVATWGHATFHTLLASQAQGRAVKVEGRLAVQELTAGPSNWSVEVEAEKMAVKFANCGEVAECSFKVSGKHQNGTDLVWPRCRAGSGIVDTDADADRYVSRGCYTCPGGEFQLQQGVAASCTPCPAIWKCTKNKLQMPKGWMAPVDPEKLRLAELNLTREGRAIQCLSEAACPGGQLPLDLAKPMCSEGRTGVLCAACTAGHYATKGECEKCQEASQEEKVHLWGTAAAVAAIGLGLAGVAWLSRGAVTEYWKQADVKWHVLKELAARQALVLLQVVQLYGILAALAPDPSTGQGASRESFWERTYVDALQLNLAQAQDAFRLQCLWDGDKVRLASALASPLAPLVMLLACGLLEIIKPSVGAGAAFKILTIFFIGGARESAALLRCQLVDKGGAPLGDFAFLQKLPFLLCSETKGVAKWVYPVGYGTGAVYVAVIPVALLYLYMRQHIVLRPSKTITAHAKRAKRSWITELRSVRALDQPIEVNDEHLLAAAVAHMAVTFQGKVWLQLQDGKAEMKSPESEGRADAELTVSSFLDRGGEVAEMLRSRAIMEMLVERCEMEKASESDGFLSGAKEVFFKYAFCRFVWMEMLQKLLAVGLVTVISTEDAFHLSLAFVLGMAATIAMVQPYIQPQMNELHFFSLLCLAAAAVGFAGAGNPKAQFPHWLWLSRVSVLLPFLLAAGQALRPDSCEALAMRLFQEARQQLEVLQKGQEVELVVKTVSFI
ncbi:unnamed protein product [Effrenium voratum]|nr:unnamed protein product [Effrenium voratum]CAJ1434294.1 unnamed protein product [Effrenium voratum]